MIRKIADNIYSPLGFTTAENYAAVKAGRSMLRSCDVLPDLPEPFTASLFDWRKVECIDGYTRFESIVIQSVRRALEQTSVDVHSDRLLFILSTTKGNIELLDSYIAGWGDGIDYLDDGVYEDGTISYSLCYAGQIYMDLVLNRVGD